MSDRTPQQTAEYVRDRMLANDRATRWLGMQVTEIAPGSAGFVHVGRLSADRPAGSWSR